VNKKLENKNTKFYFLIYVFEIVNIHHHKLKKKKKSFSSFFVVDAKTLNFHVS